MVAAREPEPRRTLAHPFAELPKMLHDLLVVIVKDSVREGMLLPVVASLTLSEHRRRGSYHQRRREPVTPRRTEGLLRLLIMHALLPRSSGQARLPKG